MMAPKLSERERQVLEGMARGKSNGEIGRELFLAENSIKTFARKLFVKVGAVDRAHAVARGYLTVPESDGDGRIVLRATEEDAARLVDGLFPAAHNVEAAREQVLAGLRRMVGAS